MKLEGRITFLINRDETYIEIEDENANARFCRISLTPEQTIAILSRQGCVKCELDINFLDRVGKKHETKTFEFKTNGTTQQELELACVEALFNQGMHEWKSDQYYNSQNSLFKKGGYDGEQWARTTIRRWV